MKIRSEELILELLETCRENTNRAEALKSMSTDELNWKSNEESWSTLECLEHLNLYGDFYLPEIERVIKGARHKKDEWFKSGLLGNYFAVSMLPKEKLNKMKTPQNMNPINSKLERTVIDRFIQQQITLIELLNKAKK